MAHHVSDSAAQGGHLGFQHAVASSCGRLTCINLSMDTCMSFSTTGPATEPCSSPGVGFIFFPALHARLRRMLTGQVCTRDTRCRLPSLTVLRAASMVCMFRRCLELRVRICRRPERDCCLIKGTKGKMWKQPAHGHALYTAGTPYRDVTCYNNGQSVDGGSAARGGTAAATRDWMHSQPSPCAWCWGCPHMSTHLHKRVSGGRQVSVTRPTTSMHSHSAQLLSLSTAITT